MVYKGQGNVRKYKFWAKSFYQYLISVFLSYAMKSYQFSKIYKRFNKERKNHSYSIEWEKKNWEQMDLVVLQSPIWMMQEKSKGKIGIGSTNGKLQYLFEKWF